MKKETRRRKPYTPPQPDPALPRIYIKENQEFVMNGRVFIWKADGADKSGINLISTGLIESNTITVTTT